MRRLILVSLTAFLILGGCSNEKKPNSANFTKAINQYLAKHGQVCTYFAQTFPIDIPASESKDQYGIAPQMAALEHAGLVHGRNTTAVIQGMMGALGPSAPRPVRRYDLTNEGKKYVQVKSDVLGQSNAFCYGQKTVDSVAKWTEPAAMGPYMQSEATYTYKIADLAPWARQAQVQQAFGDIRITVSGISKADEVTGLVLTNKGWEALEQ
ncbi:hypothetical protein [Acidobacterium sp. S8]|uniref:hypothetical protein n=1 Tax=Acidobacterium sp. S8 TaxID=1641854 RepID=UPI00131D2512|nr:hypothetical protein [Acidobacterium sp. S8]